MSLSREVGRRLHFAPRRRRFAWNRKSINIDDCRPWQESQTTEDLVCWMLRYGYGTVVRLCADGSNEIPPLNAAVVTQIPLGSSSTLYVSVTQPINAVGPSKSRTVAIRAARAMHRVQPFDSTVQRG